MTELSPPTRNPLTDDKGNLTLPWLLFFNSLFDGDAGTSWTPTFQGLTISGTPTFTGRFYKLSQYLCYFNIVITPATNTSAVAGTTYCDNFPLNMNANGFCVSVAANLGGGLGEVVASSKRIYVPTWTTVTSPINIIGIVEAS